MYLNSPEIGSCFGVIFRSHSQIASISMSRLSRAWAHGPRTLLGHWKLCGALPKTNQESTQAPMKKRGLWSSRNPDVQVQSLFFGRVSSIWLRRLGENNIYIYITSSSDRLPSKPTGEDEQLFLSANGRFRSMANPNQRCPRRSIFVASSLFTSWPAGHGTSSLRGQPAANWAVPNGGLGNPIFHKPYREAYYKGAWLHNP